MKTTVPAWFIVLVISGFSALNPQLSTCFAQGTAFTYQGRLTANGAPASGLYDFRFKLYFDSLGNTQVGASVLTNGIPANNGLFTVAIDFGSGVFNGSNYWLEVDVKTNNAGIYTDLGPLQPVTPAPYAVFASTASNVSGTISSGNISGTYGNAVTLNNPANNLVGAFTGNGANVTNVNAASLNGLTSAGFWQLGGNAVIPNQILGSTNNQPLAIYAAGLRALLITTNPADSANFIAGSPVNIIDPGVEGAVIAGGGTTNFLGQPSPNYAGANFSVIGGGSGNSVRPGADHSAIFSGWNNSILAGAYESVISGGENNVNDGHWAYLGGGEGNSIQSNADFSVLAGGWGNLIYSNSTYSVVGGGYGNVIQSNANYSAIGGGVANTVQTGSTENFIGGGGGNTIQLGVSVSFIGGGANNHIASLAGLGGSIVGGNNNAVSNFNATVGGGANNIAGGNASGIGGGSENNTAGDHSTIASGQANQIQLYADHAFIGGGYSNLIVGSYALPVDSTIGGGYWNSVQTNGIYATIGGGESNSIAGGSASATIPGGANNIANGNFSFAAGQQAQALHQGAFVWADSQNGPFSSTANDQFLIRAQGGVGINTTNPIGATLAINTGGAGTILFRNEANLIPAMVMTSSNGYSGYLRYRNVLEVFPNDAGTASGYVDVRNTNGVTISLDGSTGFVTASNFFGNGASLTSLNANNISSGTIPSASIAGSYGSAVTFNNPGNGFVGSYTGDGAGVTNVNAASLNGLNATNFWRVGGNNVSAGQFIGSTNNQPVEIHVGGVRAMRAELYPEQVNASNIVNIINGSPINFVTPGVYGGTIGGGGATKWAGTVYTNSVTGVFGTVSGGGGNSAGPFGVVGGGEANSAGGNTATVGGGQANQATGSAATVAGGFGNTAGNSGAVVPGGYDNTANGVTSLAAGYYAQALHDGSFVWADYSQFAPFSSTGTNQFLIRSLGGVGIDTASPVSNTLSINASTYLFSHPLYLRGETGADHNHALAYNGNTVTNFGTGNYQVDGPALWGFAGGLLGTRNGGDRAALTWSTTGAAVNGAFSVNGGVATLANGVQVGSAGTAMSVVESGQAIMPPSSTQETNFTIVFPAAFGSSPKIIFTLANDPGSQGVNDVFASSVSSNSPSAFSINVYRVNGVGWAQSLRVNWHAWQ